MTTVHVLSVVHGDSKTRRSCMLAVEEGGVGAILQVVRCTGGGLTGGQALLATCGGGDGGAEEQNGQGCACAT